MFDTVMTCNECSSQSRLYSMEWPPKGVICTNCGQAFKAALQTNTGRVYFTMVPHKF